MAPIATVLCVALGLLFGLAGLTALLVLTVGRYDQGRDAIIAAAVVHLLVSASLLVLPTHRRLGKVLGGIALLLFASGMLWAVFNPALAVPITYQLAAVVLFVLALARAGLGTRGRNDSKDP